MSYVKDSYLLRSESPYETDFKRKEEKNDYQLTSVEKKLLIHCKEGNFKKVVEIVRGDRVNPTFRSNQMVITAAENGHKKIVNFLKRNPRVKLHDQENLAIRLAAKNGHVDIVGILLSDKRVNPSDKSDEALRKAASWGHTKIVKLLLAHKSVDPSTRESEALRKSCRTGHVDIVSMILQDPRTQPHARNNNALFVAISYGGSRGKQMVELLNNDPRVVFSVGYREAYESVSSDDLGITSLMKPNYEKLKKIENEKRVFQDLMKKIIKYLESTSGNKITTRQLLQMKLQYIRSQGNLHQMYYQNSKSFEENKWPIPSILQECETLMHEGLHYIPIGQSVGSSSGDVFYFGFVNSNQKEVEDFRSSYTGSSNSIKIVKERDSGRLYLPHGSPAVEIITIKQLFRNIDRIVYVGGYRYGKRHGIGRLFSQDERNRVEFQGSFEDGKREGRGVLYEKDGITVSSKGEWRKDHLYKIDLDQVTVDEVRYSEIKKYLIHDNLLGKGAYGNVYKVLYKSKYCAFKMLNIQDENPNLSRVYIEQKTFETLKLCGSLNHPNVLKIFGWVKTEKNIGYLMELCKHSVSSLISRGKMKSDEKIRILFETSLGMQYLHETGVMHRDLKWENVLVDSFGVVKITDFEFSKFDETDFRVSAVNLTFLGTPYYMAPEITKNMKHDRKCDVFSFGVMMYCIIFSTLTPYSTVEKCICGTSQFQATTFPNHVANCNLRPKIDKKHPMYKEFSWCCDLCKLCWSRDADQRPSFDEILEIIRSKAYSREDKEEYILVTMDPPSDDEKLEFEEEEIGGGEEEEEEFVKIEAKKKRIGRRKGSSGRLKLVKKKDFEVRSTRIKLSSESLDVTEEKKKKNLVMIFIAQKSTRKNVKKSWEKVILSNFSLEGLREVVSGKFGGERKIIGFFIYYEDQAPFEILTDEQVENLKDDMKVLVELEESHTEKRMSKALKDQEGEIFRLKRIIELMNEKYKDLEEELENTKKRGKESEGKLKELESKYGAEKRVWKEKLGDLEEEKNDLDVLLSDYVIEVKKLREKLEKYENM